MTAMNRIPLVLALAAFLFAPTAFSASRYNEPGAWFQEDVSTLTEMPTNSPNWTIPEDDRSEVVPGSGIRLATGEAPLLYRPGSVEGGAFVPKPSATNLPAKVEMSVTFPTDVATNLPAAPTFGQAALTICNEGTNCFYYGWVSNRLAWTKFEETSVQTGATVAVVIELDYPQGKANFYADTELLGSIDLVDPANQISGVGFLGNGMIGSFRGTDSTSAPDLPDSYWIGEGLPVGVTPVEIVRRTGAGGEEVDSFVIRVSVPEGATAVLLHSPTLGANANFVPVPAGEYESESDGSRTTFTVIIPPTGTNDFFQVKLMD